MLSLIYLISVMFCLILLLRKQIIQKALRGKRERQFEALLSQKILEPHSETVKKIYLPCFSESFDEILDYRRSFGLDIREPLKKLRQYFRLFQKFSRSVHQKNFAQIMQLIFLCIFIGLYSYFITTFYPKLNFLRYQILLFNCFGTFLLIMMTSILNFILFSKIWAILLSLFTVHIQLEIGLSTNTITSKIIDCFSFDRKLTDILDRRVYLYELFSQKGESINDEISFLIDEVISILDLRINIFSKFLDVIKVLLLAIFFLPSLFYLNLQMMKSALGQVI